MTYSIEQQQIHLLLHSLYGCEFMKRLIAVISLFRNVTLSIGLYGTLLEISIEASL